MVELIESSSTKYMGKERSHGTGFINLYLGSRCQLMELREVQKDCHTLGTQKTIRKTNFLHLCNLRVMSELGSESPEADHNLPQVHNKFQQWYK